MFFDVIKMSGRLHRRGDIITYSRSPLSEPENTQERRCNYSVGEITQERRFLMYSRSPLSDLFLGRFTG